MVWQRAGVQYAPIAMGRTGFTSSSLGQTAYIASRQDRILEGSLELCLD